MEQFFMPKFKLKTIRDDRNSKKLSKSAIKNT